MTTRQSNRERYEELARIEPPKPRRSPGATPRPTHSAAVIIAAVCYEFGVTSADLERVTYRQSWVRQARLAAIILLRASGLTLRETGESLGGRTPSNIAQAQETAVARRASDPAFNARLDALEQRLGAR